MEDTNKNNGLRCLLYSLVSFGCFLIWMYISFSPEMIKSNKGKQIGDDPTFAFFIGSACLGLVSGFIAIKYHNRNKKADLPKNPNLSRLGYILALFSTVIIFITGFLPLIYFFGYAIAYVINILSSLKGLINQ